MSRRVENASASAGNDYTIPIIVGGRGSIVQRLNMRGVSTILLILVSGGRGRVAAFVSPQIPTIRTTTHTYYLQETANTQPIDKEEEVTEIEGHHHETKKKYVIIGGGWGGWGAAKSLCESGIDNLEVIMIDALPDPTGKTPYLSPSGKPVEGENLFISYII